MVLGLPKIVKSELFSKTWSTQSFLSYLYTLDMFLALVGFVVYIVDIHCQLVSYELRHESCYTCAPVSVWTRFKSMLQPDGNLRKLVNPNKVGQPGHI